MTFQKCYPPITIYTHTKLINPTHNCIRIHNSSQRNKTKNLSWYSRFFYQYIHTPRNDKNSGHSGSDHGGSGDDHGGRSGGAKRECALHDGMLLRLHANQDFQRGRVQEGVYTRLCKKCHEESISWSRRRW